MVQQLQNSVRKVVVRNLFFFFFGTVIFYFFFQISFFWDKLQHGVRGRRDTPEGTACTQAPDLSQDQGVLLILVMGGSGSFMYMPFVFTWLSYLPWACALGGGDLAQGGFPETWPGRCHGSWRPPAEAEQSPGHEHCSLWHLGSSTEYSQKVLFT